MKKTMTLCLYPMISLVGFIVIIRQTERRTSANKFQMFITIIINLLSLPKFLYDKIDTLNLISKDIFKIFHQMILK